MRRPRLSLFVAHDADVIVQGVMAMVARHPDRIVLAGVHTGSGSVGGEAAPADVALVGALGPTQVLVERVKAASTARVVGAVVAYTWGVTSTDASRLVANGASGILAMSASAGSLVDDLERIGRGEKVLRGVIGVDGFGRGQADGASARLSAREVELLTLLADGLNNAEIGEQLYLAQSTVKTYLKRLYRKLSVNTRTQAVIRAVEMGLIGHGQWAMARPLACPAPEGQPGPVAEAGAPVRLE